MSRTSSRREDYKSRRRRQDKTQRLLPFIIVAVVAVIALAILIIPSLAKPTTDVSQARGSSLGNPNAPVKVEEFGDYQCPACASFFVNLEPQIVKDYIDTGKIYFSFTPFSFVGQESIDAAQAAYCARDQNKFWEYHDTLYNNQRGENQGNFSIPNLEQFAQNLNLNMNQFKTCLEGKKYYDQVQSDYNYGVGKNVNSTPSFIVDGKLVSQDALVQTIDAALKAKGK
ncbi:MAG TPA: DsbA family protein [Anaerolineaceae bacterium]|nr:DsbA family protein [Anaerolineaceae bacterium]